MEKRFWSKILSVLLAAPLAMLSSHSGAQTSRWPHCKSLDVTVPSFPHAFDENDPLTYAYADELDGKANERFNLSGNVAVQRGNLWLEADSATYWRQSQEIKADSGVRLGDVGMAASGGETYYNLTTRRGYLLDARYLLVDQHANGESPTLVFEGPGLLTLHNATYSTCDPDDQRWRIHAGSVRLNRNDGFGSANSSYLTVYGVPVLFFPYISFPLDDRRKSGFLVPSGGTSSTNGTTIRIPYYLNLAPNYDATITGVNMHQRGFMLQTEVRYLTENSTGKFNGSLLQSDDLYDNEDRYNVSYTHEGVLNRWWRERIDLNYVSDNDYFYDFGNERSPAATTQLNEELTASYINGPTVGSMRMQGYYTVDRTIPPSERPYWMLPALNISTRVRLPSRAFDLQLPAEYVNFSQGGRVSGHRIDIAPTLSMPIERSAGFFIPSLTLFQTNYELTDTLGGSVPGSQSRTLPALALDTGLFFEREFEVGETALLHTIEPRLFYVNIPYEDQSDIPLFSTSEPTFGFGQLFQVNRFSGPDRVGDANQVTAALTSRLFDDDTGATLASVSLGQIFYFRDRVVTLNNTAPETYSKSDIIAEFQFNPARRVSLRGDFLWNSRTDVIDRGTAQAQINFGKGRILNAAYLYNRESVLEQDDYSFVWPIGNRWKAFGRWNYSHPDDLPLETMGGVAYDSCCWALRLLHHRFYRAPTEDYNESIMVELQLKGMGNVGDPIESLVASKVPGYGSF